MADPIAITAARADDWPAVWLIIQEVAAAADTFAMEPSPDEKEQEHDWMTEHPGRVVVASDAAGAVVGTANMYANRPAQGSHIASGSLMVASAARGRGVGRALLRDMIGWAANSGFAALQFNAVVETNEAAVALYRSEGFSVLGTAPGAFRHPRLGPVGLHMMWRELG